jgi:hypothetical protein
MLFCSPSLSLSLFSFTLMFACQAHQTQITSSHSNRINESSHKKQKSDSHKTIDLAVQIERIKAASFAHYFWPFFVSIADSNA